MILRRVIEHVGEQNWTAVMVDFVIVVVGVFVGIQVSNWNERINTQERAKVFSARLVNDIRYEAWSFESLIEYYDDILDNAQRTIDALSNETTADPEAFLISAYRASNYGYTDRWRATFDELIATGEIGLIEDEELLQTAIYIYNTLVFELVAESGRNSEYRKIFRKSVPFEVQRDLLDRCGDRYVRPLDYDALDDQLDYECRLESPPELIAEAAEKLMKNPELLATLQLQFADLETAMYLLTENRKESLQNLREIGGVPNDDS